MSERDGILAQLPEARRERYYLERTLPKNSLDSFF